MSTFRRPSFTIFRDEPVVDYGAAPPTASPTLTTKPGLSVRRPKLTTSLSFTDKENVDPYPQTAVEDKLKGKSKLGSSSNTATGLRKGIRSAPTSPLISNSENPFDLSSRPALATKFVVPPTKSKSKGKASKSKSSSRPPNLAAGSAASTSDARADLATPTKSTKPKLIKSHSATSVRTRRLASSNPELPVIHDAEEDTVYGADGLTMADRRARDLTVLPLADLSAAFGTSIAPEGYGSSSVLSRKRSRTLSISAEPSQSNAPSSQLTEAEEDQAPVASGSAAASNAATSQSSPNKRVRLSPRAVPLPLSAPPSPSLRCTLRAEATLVEEVVEVPNLEPRLVEPFIRSSASPGPQ